MIFITGMHRSGTSLVAQVLYNLGLEFGNPKDFIKKDYWNTNGYLENKNFINLNNKIILGKQLSEDYIQKNVSKFFPRLVNNLMSKKWKYLFFPNQNELKSNFKTIYANKEFDFIERKKELFVKDPRFCLTIRFWQSIYDIDYIFFAFRNPLSVASSIYKRDGLPKFIGLKLWEYHIKTFFENVKDGTKIKLINFDNFSQESTYSLEINKIQKSCKIFNIKNTIIDNKVFNKKLVNNHFIENNISKKKIHKLYENLSKLSEGNTSFIDYDFKIKNNILS